MSDDEKIELIARFEKWDTDRYGSIRPAYPHDLNATMRAARRLPECVYLEADSMGSALIADERVRTMERIVAVEEYVQDDPARAAFECLAEYLQQQAPAAESKEE